MVCLVPRKGYVVKIFVSQTQHILFLTCQVILIVKTVGAAEIIKSRIAKPRVFFLQLKTVLKNKKTRLPTQIRILEAAEITGVKYGSEAPALQKMEEGLLDVFSEKFPTDYFVYPTEQLYFQ